VSTLCSWQWGCSGSRRSFN